MKTTLDTPKPSRVIGLYLTKFGKEAVRLLEHIDSSNRKSYSWIGRYGAGSGEPLASYLAMIKQFQKVKRGMQTIIDANTAMTL